MTPQEQADLALRAHQDARRGIFAQPLVSAVNAPARYHPPLAYNTDVTLADADAVRHALGLIERGTALLDRVGGRLGPDRLAALVRQCGGQG